MIARSMVDFPAPFAPSTQTVSPSLTARSTPWTISTPSYPVVIPETSSMRRPLSGSRLRIIAKIGRYHARIADDGSRFAFADDLSGVHHHKVAAQSPDNFHQMFHDEEGDSGFRQVLNGVLHDFKFVVRKS